MEKIGRKGFFGKFAALFGGVAFFNADNNVLVAEKLKPNQYEGIKAVKGVLQAGDNMSVDMDRDRLVISSTMTEGHNELYDNITIDLVKMKYADEGSSYRFQVVANGIKEDMKVSVNIDGKDTNNTLLKEVAVLTNECPSYDTVFYYKSCMVNSHIESGME